MHDLSENNSKDFQPPNLHGIKHRIKQVGSWVYKSNLPHQHHCRES